MLVPQPPGPAAWLTGNNTAYARTLLDESRDILQEGRWEDVLHESFRQRDVVLWCRPDIVVDHKKHYTIGEYTSQRFFYARAYAGARVATQSAIRRALYGAMALALPPVLLWRIVRRVWASGAHRRELWKSMLLLPLFVTAWGLGETAGAWLGAGQALSRVK